MAKNQKKEEKIRVHNKSNRDFEYRNEKGEIKKIEHGRAVEVTETKALKLIADYPRDLMNFEDMLSGDRKDINKENKRLKKENEKLEIRIAELEEKLLDYEKPEAPEGDSAKGGE